MRKTRIAFIFIISVTLVSYSFSQDNVSELIKNFVAEDWETVESAKQSLEDMEQRAIPNIIQLLDKDEVVKLTNTGTLIYPGAEKFFGHGQIVDYDIDDISVRAGWLLEDISFNNFGFTGIHLPKEDLEDFIKITFPSYYNNSMNRRKIESSSPEELRNILHILAVDKAKEWWKEEGDSWNRLQALVDALKSFDEKRQVKALFYMRNGETSCTGLTKDYYIENISKEIVRLSTSDTKRVSEHARFILFDTQFMWLDEKN